VEADAVQTDSHDIHFWVGEDSNVEDYGFSVYRTAELDTFLGGTAVQHREIQGYESPLFISYFKTTHFHDGAASTGKREHKVRASAHALHHDDRVSIDRCG
jgi:gelsolin